MPNNKLILRSLTSPWVTPFNDITTGSVLSWADVDNNFIYLKGELIYSAETSGTNLILNKINGNNITINLDEFGAEGNMWHIPSGTTVEIAENFQSFIFGDLYIEGLLKLNDGSQLVVLNGDIILSGGSISGNGTTLLVDLPTFNTVVTGGTYSNGTTIFTNNSGGIFSVTGYTTDFTGNTSASCISDLWLSNLHGCSPITIHSQLQFSGSTASGLASFAEGSGTTASGVASHAEGGITIASGNASHAEGYNTTASGVYSHAGGSNSTAGGDYSFIHSTNSVVTGIRSAIIGGKNITGTTDNTVYVPNLNINTAPPNDDALTNVLVRAADGTVKYRLASSIGSPTLYSNVIFVDAVNGNDSTGILNDFAKPFLTMVQAVSYASTLTRSSTNRCLIYIRRGSYNCYAGFYDHIDYYSEPGVIYTSGGILAPTAISVNFYGYAVFINSYIDIRTASNFNIEFDYMSTDVSSAIYIAPSTGTATVNIKANYIYSNTLGSGFGISIRNSSNVTFNVSRGIEAVHSTISFRFFTGSAIINCPKIYLGSGNLYGGNYKQAIVCYDVSTTGSIIINGDIENKDTVNYGGIGSLVTVYSGANPKLIINGNLKGGPIKALDGNTQTSGTIQITGNIASDNSTYTVWAYGNGELVFKNCIISNSGLNSSPDLIAVNGTAKIFFKDCYLYNATSDSKLIVVNNASTSLVLDGCSGQSNGAAGNSIYSSVGAVNVRVNNSRFNKDKSVDITDLYSPSGFIYDTNTIVPTKIF